MKERCVGEKPIVTKIEITEFSYGLQDIEPTSDVLRVR